MRIVALKYGESVYNESYIFKGGRKDILLPISFVIYLLQTQGKNILIDVGCDDKAGFNMSVFKKPVEILKEYKVSPEEITDVVITHSHHDHIEAIGYYKNAVVHIQKDEFQKSQSYIPYGFNLNIFEDEYALTDKVIIKKIAGHSIGSCVVLADKYVFCGDECYYKKCLTDKIITGASCNDKKSRQFIEEYSIDKYTPLLCHDPEVLAGKIGCLEIL